MQRSLTNETYMRSRPTSIDSESQKIKVYEELILPETDPRGVFISSQSRRIQHRSSSCIPCRIADQEADAIREVVNLGVINLSGAFPILGVARIAFLGLQ